MTVSRRKENKKMGFEFNTSKKIEPKVKRNFNQDFISRADAIEEIEDLTCSMSICLNKDMYEGMKSFKERALQALKNLPAIGEK